MPTDDNNGWSKAELYVREELKRLKAQQDKLSEKMDAIGKDVVSIKTEQRIRGGMFGAAGGMVAAGLLKLAEMLGAR